MKQMYEKIDFIAKEYDKILKWEELRKSAEEAYGVYFDLGEDAEHRNPFARDSDFDNAITSKRGWLLREVIWIFNEKYPNVHVTEEEFKQFLCDQWQNRDFGVDWEGVKQQLRSLSDKADILATRNLLEHSLLLIPRDVQGGYGAPDRFKVEDILKKNRLQLFCAYAYDYSYSRRDRLSYFLKLLSAIFGEAPSTAKEYDDVDLKQYQNGRLDVKFKDENKARTVAEYLVKHQKNSA